MNFSDSCLLLACFTHSFIMSLSSEIVSLLAHLALPALGAHVSKMASTSSSPRSRTTARRQRSSQTTGMNPLNRADLAVRPPDARSVPNRVPRSIQSQIVWDVVKIATVVNTSTTVVTETNFNMSLVQHPQSGQYVALYDQWTIPQASMSIFSQTPPGFGTSPSMLYTALDFDNASNIATVAAISDFSTCAVNELSPTLKLTRSIKPCCKGNISSATSAACERLWIDTSQPSVPFFGFRTIAGPSSTGSIQFTVEITIYFAFRNQV